MAKSIQFNIKLTVDGKTQLVTATTGAKSLQKALDAGRTSSQRLRDSLSNIGSAAMAFQSAVSGMQSLLSAMNEYTQAYAVQEQNEKRRGYNVSCGLDAHGYKTKNLKTPLRGKNIFI